MSNTLHTEAYSPQAVSRKGRPSVIFISISHGYSKDVSTSFPFLLLIILYAVCVYVCEFKAEPSGSDGTESTSMQDTQIQSWFGKIPLEEGMTTHSSVLAMDRGAWWATQSIGLQRVGHK